MTWPGSITDASMASHLASQQHLSGAISEDEPLFLLSWVMATCRATWPSEGDVPTSPFRWQTMQEL